MKTIRTMFRAAALIAGAAVLALLPAAPANAQTFDAANTVILQGTIVGQQVAGAVANATSNTSNAKTDALGAVMLNSSSVDNAISATSEHLGTFGAMGAQANTVVGQLSGSANQAVSGVANSLAAGVSEANSTALAAGNMSQVKNVISTLTSRNN
ncbi:MAG: hypothetical protein JWL87_376 [Candidatus Adlerbacteria bacterium]|nr:hypothetical protein [Candidatus Adlerbacteria bacterium]